MTDERCLECMKSNLQIIVDDCRDMNLTDSEKADIGNNAWKAMKAVESALERRKVNKK